MKINASFDSVKEFLELANLNGINIILKKLNDKKLNFSSLLLSTIFLTICIFGCSSASDDIKDESESEPKADVKIKSDVEESEASRILIFAKEEQENEMYSPDVDSTYLYWLNNRIIILNGSSKCNIFALNVLYKSGFKTPYENALSRDLFDTTKFIDMLPVVGINDISNARKGDIVVWYSHVIVFESQIEIGNELYALSYWAGTSREDNEENIKNNVCYGKYKLNGDYVVRRPVKKR